MSVARSRLARATIFPGGLELDLPLNPVPQARPIVTFPRNAKGARTFTPDRTRQFYVDFRTLVRAAGIRQPLTGELELELLLWRQHARNHRGDLSNMVKAIEDAGNGYLWGDDSQIIGLRASIEESGPQATGRIWLRARPVRR